MRPIQPPQKNYAVSNDADAHNTGLVYIIAALCAQKDGTDVSSALKKLNTLFDKQYPSNSHFGVVDEYNAHEVALHLKERNYQRAMVCYKYMQDNDLEKYMAKLP